MSNREDRCRQLRMAIKRIQVGRPKHVSIVRKLSISAVAEEAGVSPSTIHTRYPEIAEEVRAISGLRTMRHEKSIADIEILRRQVRSLRADLREARRLLAATASMYASALSQISVLESATSSGGKIRTLPRRAT